MHITLIAGARPNLMKIAALVHAIEAWNAQKPTSDSFLKGGEKRVEYSIAWCIRDSIMTRTCPTRSSTS